MIQSGLNDYLFDAIRMEASDLHITAGLPPMIRVHGKVRPLDYPELTPTMTREMIYDILSNDQRRRLENDWELDFSYSLPRMARFRVNVYFQKDSLGAAFRTIPDEIKGFEELGLPKAVGDMADKPRGLVLITGPTGSGKSTTLAAMIDKINETRQEHIMSVEDPIEFLHAHTCDAQRTNVERHVPRGLERAVRVGQDLKADRSVGVVALLGGEGVQVLRRGALVVREQRGGVGFEGLHLGLGVLEAGQLPLRGPSAVF